MDAKGAVSLASLTVAFFTGACSPASPPPARTVTQTVTATTPASPSASDQEPPTAVAPPPTVGMNEAARDGTFVFTHFIPYKPAKQIGDNFAQGTFIWLLMKVKNIGNVPQRYSADYQSLVDSEGRVFSPDTDALSLNSPRPPFDINPGNEAITLLYFDVPEGTQPSQYVLLLHSSPDSVGVAVRLR